MRKKCFWAAALLLGAASLAAAAPPPGNAKAGKAVYGTSCQGCHGPNGEGNPAIAKMMKVTMLPLGSKQVQAKTDAQLKKDIVNGTGKMPGAKSLSAKQVDDVIAYVRELGHATK